jgi:isoaspartyl peptidase/L-asparaginase-like protein (Ntn-hydrolase superfamily)
MIENYQEIIDKMSKEEAMEIVSKMGMNMTDHPYLSEERRKELKDEEERQIKEYENKRKEKTSDNQTIGK